MDLIGCRIPDNIIESTLVMGVLSICSRGYQTFKFRDCMLNVFRRFVIWVVIVPCESIYHVQNAHVEAVTGY